MIRTSVAAFAFALAACSPPASEQPAAEAAPAQEASASGCVVTANPRELQFGGETYRVEARAEGASCEEAVASLRLLNPAGTAIFETAYPTNQVPLAFRAAGADEARLTEELNAWTANVAQQPTADSLPAWPEGAERPQYFTPAIGRDGYEAARSAQRPLFCFPDGGESNACVAIDTSAKTAVLLGAWTPERQ
ncbi:MAG: hypothetical protein AB7G05_08755 [Hyphomonadaceae bacterium]